MRHLGTLRRKPDPSTKDKHGGRLDIEENRDGSISLVLDPEGVTVQLTRQQAQKLASLICPK